MDRRVTETGFAAAILLWCLLPSAALGQGRGAPPARDGEASAVVSAEAANDLRLSRVIGLEVDGPRGYSFGRVVDVVIDAQHEVVRYVAVQADGLFGRTVAVPLSDVRVATSDRGVVHTPVPDTRFALGTDPSGLPAAPDLDAGDSRSGGPPATQLRGSRILGASVVDSRDATVGTVRDVVFDLRDGRLRFVVLAVEGSPFDRWVTVRPGALSPPRGSEPQWRLNVGSDSLDAAPRFDPAEWAEPSRG